MLSIMALTALQNVDYSKINMSQKNQQQVVAFNGHSDSSFFRVPLATFQAYSLASMLPKKAFEQTVAMPETNKTKYSSFDDVMKDYQSPMNTVIDEFDKRKDLNKNFLKWVALPAAQMKKNEAGVSHLDEIYAQVGALKARSDVDRPLVVLGIGGSKHTAEFLLNMNGMAPTGRVKFYSDVDPISYENFKKEIGNVKNVNFLVVSKSGTTFETSDAFKRFEQDLIKEYKKTGLSTKDAEAKAQEHFAIATDATPNDRNLRGKIGNKNGEGNNYIKELYIHDDVGGRYSMFDDPSLFALAYSGVDKSVAKRILKAADNASKKSMSKNLAENTAAQSAIFNVFARDNGYNMTQQQYYGRLFEGGGENWAKQLYLESIKDFDFAIGKAPDSMHYATEGHFSPENRDKYNTIMTIMSPDISANYKKYTGAIAKTYNETTPLKTEILDVENGAIKPEAIGEYIQAKHFETVYTGMLMRAVKGENQPEILPEILQPSVETYKNKFKKGSPYELAPGK